MPSKPGGSVGDRTVERTAATDRERPISPQCKEWPHRVEPPRSGARAGGSGIGAQPTASATNSNRRCAVSADLRTRYQALDFHSSVTGRQFGDLPNMIQPPLLGVVNAASAVSARTLTCRAPAVPRSCSMLSVYMAVRVRPFPKLPPLEQNGCGPSTLISPA